MERVLGAIKIKGKKDTLPKREEYLLYHGGRFKIDSAKSEGIEFEKMAPFSSGRFQIYRKLYVVGGERQRRQKTEYLPSLFSLDYSGKQVELEPMRKERGMLSVSGLQSVLVAVGGWNQHSLDDCEKFLIRVNKWRELPPLNAARFRCGTVLLQSWQAFCFCGSEKADRDLNSIEKL